MFRPLRRYFFEAAICRYPVGLQGLMRIRAIYAADDAFRKQPPATAQALREQHVRPLVTSFFDVGQASARPARKAATSRPRRSATRSIKRPSCCRVLDDAKLPLDNTRSERALRKIVVGRKNWMFYGSDTHAEGAAAIFSIIASCRLHRLDPFAVPGRSPARPAVLAARTIPRARSEHWAATRTSLDPDELDAPLCSFTIPPA